MERFAGVSAITTAMVRRNELPVAITEKLVSLVTGEVFDHLVNHHELPPQIGDRSGHGRARTRDASTSSSKRAGRTTSRRFVQQLNLNGRLTPSLLMRGLCLGHMDFVEHAMAELAGTRRISACGC